MDRKSIESLVHAWATEGVAQGRLDVFDRLLDVNVTDLSGGRESRGADSFKARAGAVGAAFSQRSVSVDTLVVEANHIAWRWTLRGVHTGAFGDVAPTNKPVALSGVNFQTVRDERVTEHWTLADIAGLLRQFREPAR
jgi:predicted ester cyclase